MEKKEQVFTKDVIFPTTSHITKILDVPGVPNKSVLKLFRKNMK